MLLEKLLEISEYGSESASVIHLSNIFIYLIVLIHLSKRSSDTRLGTVSLTQSRDVI